MFQSDTIRFLFTGTVAVHIISKSIFYRFETITQDRSIEHLCHSGTFFFFVTKINKEEEREEEQCDVVCLFEYVCVSGFSKLGAVKLEIF